MSWKLPFIRTAVAGAKMTNASINFSNLHLWWYIHPWHCPMCTLRITNLETVDLLLCSKYLHSFLCFILAIIYFRKKYGKCDDESTRPSSVRKLIWQFERDGLWEPTRGQHFFCRHCLIFAYQYGRWTYFVTLSTNNNNRIPLKRTLFRLSAGYGSLGKIDQQSLTDRFLKVQAI